MEADEMWDREGNTIGQNTLYQNTGEEFDKTS